MSLWTQCFGKNKSNTIENTAVVRSGWRRKVSKERLVFPILNDETDKSRGMGTANTIPRDEQKCIPACHTFYMSYDKHVKCMTSVHLCLHTSLHGYFFITL